MRGHRSHTSNRARTGITLLLFALVLSCATAFAHPMGNFSVNHYSKVTIKRGSIEILYLIDMAEIPTFQEIRQFDITPTADDPSASRYLHREQQSLREGLSLQSDGQLVQLDTESRQVTFASGAGGLPTMKIRVVFRGELNASAGDHQLAYVDNNFPGRAGWKEVVVLGDGVGILQCSAPGTDRSQELTNYSSDALNSPPQQLSARAGFRTSFREVETSASAEFPATASRPAISRTNAIGQTQPPSPTHASLRRSRATASPVLNHVQSSPGVVAATSIPPPP